MKIRRNILCLAIFLLGLLSPENILADTEIRQKVIEFLQSTGLSKHLYASVKISQEESGVISIADEGNFLMQYMIVEPNVSADANLVVDPRAF